VMVSLSGESVVRRPERVSPERVLREIWGGAAKVAAASEEIRVVVNAKRIIRLLSSQFK
jgi:hypothetical protein